MSRTPACCALPGAPHAHDTRRRPASGRMCVLQTHEVVMSGKLLLGPVALAFTMWVALAGAPVDNINSHKHPNLAAAQRLSTQAYEKISQAQQANEWDMGGHAQRAKELLDQVNRELKEAAEVANHR